MKKLLSKKGSITVLTALLLPIMLAFTGFAVDVGRLYIEKAKLQNLADAAALAGFTQLKLDTDDANDFVLQGNLIPNMPIGAITDINTKFKTIENKKVVERYPLDLANNGANRYLKLNSGDFYSTSSSSVQTRLYHTANSQVEDSFYYELVISGDYPLYFAKIVYPENTMQVRAGALVKFDRVEKIFNSNTYTKFLNEYGKKGRRAIVNLPEWPYHYSYLNNPVHFEPSQMTDRDEEELANYKRLEVDRTALNNIAEFLLGMDYDFLKTTVFNNKFADNKFKNTQDLWLLSYTDHARVEENYVAATYDDTIAQYSGNTFSEAHTVMTVTKTDTAYGFDVNDVIHWMQGDYGNYMTYRADDSDKNYTKSQGYQQGVRYFFSNDVIMPTYDNKSTIQVSFNIGTDPDNNDKKVVQGVRVKLKKDGGSDYPDAYVVKGTF